MKRIFAVVILALAGCMIGPDYHRPELILPDTYRIELGEAQDVAQLKWWDQFQDPELTALIEISLQQNLDLLAATFAVEEFYARYGISRSALFPQIFGTAYYSREQPSGSLFGIPELANPRDVYSAAVSLAWELDIWGRIRRANEAARADILSQEAGRHGVILTLVTNVASSYIKLRQLDRQLEITHETLRSRQDVYNIINERFKGGIIPELDVKQAESEVLTAKAAIPVIETAIFQTENLLSFLVGENSRNIARARTLSEFVKSASVPKGLPSEILQNRPDIIQAEAAVQGSSALIGVARAEYFPRLTLTGDYGFISTEFSDWMEHSSNTWGWGPEINLPIFTAGRISSEVEAAKAAYERAARQYRNSVLNGLREVNDALVATDKNKEKLKHLSDQTKVLQRYYELARRRYDEGQTSYLEVLDAERRYFQSQLQEVDAQNDRVQSIISLFRAMGGGWVAEADKGTVQPVDR